MKPIYQISVAGEIIDFGDRLISLQISHERDRFDPVGCDSLEIVLDDSKEPRLQIPPRGRALRVAIGYEGQGLVDKGIFIVDQTEVVGPPTQLIIRGQNNSKTPNDATWLPMQTCMNRSWQTPLTIQKLVTQVAVDHGLFPVVSPQLASIELPHIDQANMSDDELLNQYVCRVHDAIYYVQDSKLLVIKNGYSETVSGRVAEHTFLNVAPVGETLDPEKIYVSSWGVRFVDFLSYQTVTAAWYDYASAAEKEERTGSGRDPVLRLPFVYPNQSSAKAATQTAWNRNNAFEGELRAAFPGVPNIYVGGKLSLAGAHPDVENISWYCRRATHTIDRSGFWTEATGERLTADLQAQIAGGS